MTCVLVVDDEPGICKTTARLLSREGFSTAQASDTEAALEQLSAGSFDVVISDIVMPGASGVELLRSVQGVSPETKVILVTGEPTVETAAEAVRAGAFDYLSKPVDRGTLLKVVHDAARFKALEDENRDYQRNLERLVLERTDKLEQTLNATVEALGSAMELKDPYTTGHQRRVAALAGAVAEGMGWSADRIEGLRLGGLLHDIGKLHVPSEILAKPSRLTPGEFALIKEHPKAGHEIIQHIDFPWPIATMVLQHHERLDGTGYPDGINGDEIIEESRILAVADVVEAMASHRPYRPSLGIDTALEEIEAKKGSHFDPEVADLCITLFRDGKFQFNGDPH